MRLHSFVLPTLAGCLLACNPEPCDPPTEEIEIDKTLQESVIRDLVDYLAVDRRVDIECAQACEYMYTNDNYHRWEFDSSRDCQLQIDEEAAEDPDAEVGSLHCYASGYEYGCK